MSHEEIQDLLEAYVDDKLDRSTRRVVDQHLAGCAECRSILDEVAPVDIGALGPMRSDQRMIRRTIRRSLLRTAVNTVFLMLAALIVTWFFSALVFQPWVINRGGRAADAAQAEIDLTTMSNPGAVVTQGQIQSGFFDRVIELDVVMLVGATERSLGSIVRHLGALSLSGTVDQMSHPDELTTMEGDALDRLGQLGSGTVATVAITLDHPISIQAAQSIADSTDHDIRVTWAGFEAKGADDLPPSWTALGTVGYATCLGPDGFDEQTLGASSAGFGRSVGSSEASIQAALDSVRSALANLVRRPQLIRDIAGGSPDPIEMSLVAENLANSPMVGALVITGPSDEIAEYLSDNRAQVPSSKVLAVDFYNWSTSVCGR